MPQISVIIPVFNGETYLAECLDSILTQTYTNFEIILVNDGSTDDSKKICDAYAIKDNRIKVFHKKNEGVSLSRNLGIEVSSGKWIMFVDADDWLDIETLEKVILVAEDNDSEVVLFDFVMEYSRKSKVISFLDDFSFSTENDRENMLCLLLYSNTVRIGVPWAKLYRADLVKPQLRFAANISQSEDLCFNFSFFCMVNKVNYLKESLYHYRQQSMSVCHSFKPQGLTLYDNVHKYLEPIIYSRNSKKIKDAYYACVIKEIRAICFNCIFHYENIEKFSIKSIKFKNMILQFPFAEAIIYTDIKELFFKDAFFICLLKTKSSIIVWLIYKINLLIKKMLGYQAA